MHAKVDPKIFNIDDGTTKSAKKEAKPPSDENVQTDCESTT